MQSNTTLVSGAGNHLDERVTRSNGGAVLLKEPNDLARDVRAEFTAYADQGQWGAGRGS